MNRPRVRRLTTLSDVANKMGVEEEADEVAASSDALLKALQAKHPDYLKTTQDVVIPPRKIR